MRALPVLVKATLEWHTATVLEAVHELAPLVVGQDAGRIQHLWQSVYRRRFWRGGPALLSALSGLEQALWDIKGKVAGLPVYELLGAPVATGCCSTPIRPME